MLSTYSKSVIVDTLFRSGTVYLGLLSGDTEASYPSYARAEITMSALTGGETFNTVPCEIPGNGAPATSYEVDHVAIFSASGQHLLTLPMDEAVTLTPREFIRFEAGDIRWTPEAP
jgi:hypothetical protein